MLFFNIFVVDKILYVYIRQCGSIECCDSIENVVLLNYVNDVLSVWFCDIVVKNAFSEFEWHFNKIICINKYADWCVKNIETNFVQF